MIFVSNQRMMFKSKNYLLQVKCRRKKHFLPWILTLKQTVDSMCNLYYLLLFFSLLWHCKTSPFWWHTKCLLYWKSAGSILLIWSCLLLFYYVNCIFTVLFFCLYIIYCPLFYIHTPVMFSKNLQCTFISTAIVLHILIFEFVEVLHLKIPVYYNIMTEIVGFICGISVKSIKILQPR